MIQVDIHWITSYVWYSRSYQLNFFFFCKHDSCNLLRKDTTKARHGIRRQILDNVRAALLVAVKVSKLEGAGIETRCRQSYGLFGRCHGECELVVRKGVG